MHGRQEVSYEHDFIDCELWCYLVSIKFLEIKGRMGDKNILGGFFINIEQKKYTPLLVKLVYETDELIGTYLILT